MVLKLGNHSRHIYLPSAGIQLPCSIHPLKPHARKPHRPLSGAPVRLHQDALWPEDYAPDGRACCRWKPKRRPVRWFAGQAREEKTSTGCCCWRCRSFCRRASKQVGLEWRRQARQLYATALARLHPRQAITLRRSAPKPPKRQR